MALDFHPLIETKNSEASNLLLSVGMDWRLGLWYPKNRNIPVFMNDMETEIYDVKWSPTHPSVFATADGQGHIDLWDISKETESFRYRKEDPNKRAINKIRWTRDGKKLLSGNSMGVVKLWSVDKEFY